MIFDIYVFILGLVQHDQLKDEVMKQNLLPFFLECTNKFTDTALITTLKLLWSLTFREEGALALRSNKNFLDKIQTISKDNNNEPLKKAADGLVWKLIRGMYHKTKTTASIKISLNIYFRTRIFGEGSKRRKYRSR